MKVRIDVIATSLLLLPLVVIGADQNTVPQEWLSRAMKQIQQDEYNPSLQVLDYQGKPFSQARCHFANRANNLRAYFDKQGMQLMPRVGTDSWAMMYNLGSVYRARDKSLKVVQGTPAIIDNKVVYQYQGMTLEYANAEQGITQQLIIQERPDGEGELYIRADIKTQGQDNVVFTLDNVEDANQNTLPGSMKREGNQVVVSITDDNAQYPISVQVRIASSNGQTETSHYGLRGLNLTPDWTAESNQDSALFGYSVATAGDVNGDGYSDVIVGAFYYDNGMTDEGAAFVYHGSASGLSSTPDWIGESNQPYAMFGYSVATAGDVNGDGYSDVIVGALLYSHPDPQEGVAFVYHGSASGLSSAPDWIGEPNQASAAFGWFVSSAGDVNGDGYSDVIVGAIYYDDGETDEGAAFVYYGSGSGLSSAPDWMGESNQAGAYFGNSVATAGDVNGDGYSDVIVGALYYDNGETDEGAAFAYYGSASGLSSAPDWTEESDQADACFGYSVASAGDVNGDGYSDVIVGAIYYDNGETNEGAAFVYHGSGSGLSLAPDWTAESNTINAGFGLSAATAGDVNGDGYGDVIVGAPWYTGGELSEGRAYVYHGSGAGLSLEPDWTDESNQNYAYFGVGVSTAGDVNGDGYSDVIVGAFYYDNGQTDEGGAFVYHGAPDGLDTAYVWLGESDQEYAEYGCDVASAGDVNGDGYGDVIVGAWRFDNGQNNEGAAFVYHGSAVGLSVVADWIGEANYPDAHYGCAVSGAGDVNGDGYGDVIIGAYRYTYDQFEDGRAFVYHGSASGLSSTPAWQAQSDQELGHFGFAVASAGDINGDGCSDVIVGAPTYDHGELDEGVAYVYHGSPAGLQANYSWSGEANQESAMYGSSVASAGDVNGDGYADVVVGAHYYNNGEDNEGRAYVYYGSPSGVSVTADWIGEINQSDAHLGYAVSTAGDVNGDGYSDVLVGAHLYHNGETAEGAAFVYHGSASGLSLVADWVVESNIAFAKFGMAVGTAGDVNGDGYSDVVIGAPEYSIIAYEGRAYVFYGSASGLSLTEDWLSQSDQFVAFFGYAVSSAGDVNGDGYSDVIVGAYGYDHAESDEGCAFVYYGNGAGLAMVPCQAVTDGTRLVQLLNKTDEPGVEVRLIGRTPAGRGKVKLQWEVKELGQLMNGQNLGESVDWYDTGLEGVEIAEDVLGLDSSTSYHWRVRLVYSPLTYNGAVYSRWFSIGPNGVNEGDFITTPLTGIAEGRTTMPQRLNLRVSPTISRAGFRVQYGLAQGNQAVRMTVYDQAGRLVKTLIDAKMPAGWYEMVWPGDDNQGRSLASGVYFVSLTNGEHTVVTKALVVR